MLGKVYVEATKYVLDGRAIRILNQNDLLGRLSSPNVCLENFEILGEYVLLRAMPGQVSPTIKIPTQYVPRECWQFFVIQKGVGVNIPISIGQEIYAERDKTTQLEMQSKHKLVSADGHEIEDDQVFGFCDSKWIHGCLFVEEAEPAVLTE